MLHDESTELETYRHACQSLNRNRKSTRDEPTEEAAFERAAYCSRKVEIAIAKLNFPAAHAAIALCEREYLATLSPRDARTLELAETGLDTRTVNHLEEAGIVTLEQLAEAGEDRLRRTPNFGDATIRKIQVLLEALGMYEPPE